VRKARNGETRWTLNEKTADIIKKLARHVPDMRIASILNRAGNRTGREQRIDRERAFRSDHGIAPYRDGERAERGELNQLEAAAALGSSRMTILRLIRRGILKGRQACKGAVELL
jgi:hypothetical protein